MKRILKNNYKYEYIAFILSFLTASIIILPNLITNKGIFNVISDFDIQQIPFNMAVNNAIKSGEIYWSWFNDLGSNFLATFSFYNSFSLFNIIGYIFPAQFFKYLIGPIFILKYAISGLTSFLFIKRYTKNKWSAIIGSLVYSFSGYQLTNTLFYHFHDAVAIFPLMLYTLDNLVYDNKKGRFLIVVAISALTNWMFFIGQVVFVVLYVIIKYITKNYKFDIKNFINIFLEGLLGTLISCIILIPSALFTLGNPRVSGDWNLSRMIKYDYLSMYIEIMRAFIFPAEVMYPRAFLTNMNFTSIDAYLPIIGVIPSAAYILKNKKSFFSILSIVCIIFLFVPILNSSFSLFRTNYYVRWIYMFILIISTASSISVDKNIDLKKTINIYLLGVGFFCLFLIIVLKKQMIANPIFDINFILIALVIFVFSIVLLNILNNKRQNIKITCLIISIIMFSGFWGNYLIYKYKGNTFNTNTNYFEYLTLSDKLSINQNLRSNSADTCYPNLGYILNINNLKSFNSNISGTSFSFYNSIGIQRDVSTNISIYDDNLNQFLGIKYIVTCGDEMLNENYKLVTKYENYKVYENKEVNPIGFIPQKYILNNDFEQLDYENRKEILKDTVVLNEEQVKQYRDLFNKENIYQSKYKFVSNGFISNIKTNNPSLAVYTIPYDKGWKVSLNGKIINYENIDNGFIGIELEKGNNDVIFKYYPPGLGIGKLLSIVGLVFTSGYIIINWMIRRKKCKSYLLLKKNV